MTRKELNLAIFEGSTDKVLWQPRLETWIHHHRAAGTLPERFQDLDYLGIYDALGCSVRYAASAGIDGYEEPADIERTAEQDGIYISLLSVYRVESYAQYTRISGKTENFAIGGLWILL